MFEPRKVARARRAEWHCMFTATGFIVMCVRRRFDVHRERGRIAAKSLGTDAEHVHRLAELGFELRALGIGAVRAERPRRRDLGQVHAKVRRTADPYADDGRRTGLAAGVEHAVDDERLDRIDAFGGYCHAQPGIVLRARALGDHFDRERLVVGEIDVDHRYAATAGAVLVLARDGVNDRRTQRMLARRAASQPRGSPP